MFQEIIINLIASLVIFAGGWIMSNVITGKRRQALKNILGIKKSQDFNGVRIITPVYHKQPNSKLMHHKDGIAVSYVLKLLHDIGVNAHIVAYHEISSNSQDSPRDTVVIASPVSNSKCEEYMKKYVPRFVVIDERNEVEKNRIPASETDARKENGDLKFGFRIFNGDQNSPDKMNEIPIYEDNDYGVLIKLDTQHTRLEKTIHLLFGMSATGTAAAAYYLAKHYSLINKVHNTGSYCLLVRVDRREGYKHVRHDFIDISSALHSL
jgi:hypothetical protein